MAMIDAIGKHLMTGDVSRMFSQQLQRCKQGRSESVRELAFKLERLASIIELEEFTARELE